MNQKKKLTKSVVDSAKPQEKLYYISDTEVNGFRLIIRASGSKTYVFDYRMGKGRKFPKKRITIGAATKYSPDQAREKAKSYLAQVINGQDPSREEKKKNDKHAFEDVWWQYIDEHVRLRNKPRTQKGVIERGETKVIPFFKGMYVEDITHQDIHDFMLSMKAGAGANRCRAMLSKMFNLCEIPWKYRPRNSNPVKGIFKYPEKRRERFLDDNELVRLMDTLNEIIEENMAKCEDKTRFRALHRVRAACYFKLMLFTGARGVEWREAKLEEIDLERMQLRPESTKNDEPAITLPPEAIDILKFVMSLPRPPCTDDNPYLFPSKYTRSEKYQDHMGPQYALWAEIKKRANIKNFNPHDNRHSWAAFALASGLSLADVGQQLNHKTYQTTKRYEHLADKVKRQNAAAVGNAISSISQGKAEIIDIRTRKAVDDRNAGES